MYRQTVKQEWSPPEELRTVSLKTVAELLDTTRTSARRWLKEAGVQPIAVGRGRKGAIRYRWQDVAAWLESRQYVD
jgi:hypothetical protein